LSQSSSVLPITQHARPTQAWTEVHAICCETANAGAPRGDPARWPFFGELWVGPYERRWPSWTWVGVGESQDLLGYITLCPNTQDHELWMTWVFRPQLALKILLGRYAKTLDTQKFLKRWLGLEKSPEHLFPREILQKVHTQYPAHLHTNLRARARGTGLGKALWEAGASQLRTHQIPGIHLFCGDAPVGFYRKCGFEILHTVEWRPGVKVHLMVQTLVHPASPST